MNYNQIEKLIIPIHSWSTLKNTLKDFINRKDKKSRVLMNFNKTSDKFNDNERLRKCIYLDKLVYEIPILHLNQYEIKKINSQNVLDILKTHRKVIESDHLYENPFYKEPDELIAKLDKELEVYSTLSFREKRVLTLIVDGLSNVKVYKELSISVKTVETRRANIMKKLGTYSVVELIKLTINNKII